MMSRNEPPETIIAEAILQLVRALTPERIYLFGSQARGDATYDSDYDLLVVMPASDHPRYVREQAAYRALAGHSSGVLIEVVVLTRDEFDRELLVVASLPATVAREGRLLYAAA
jgi:uncharacterized protein